MVKGLVLLAALLMATAAVGKPATKARWADVLSPLVKVRPGARLEGAGSARLLAARGECEAFQVLAKPPLTDVRAYLMPLRGPGKRVPARLYREAFIEVKTPSNSDGAPGLWPDPLIPAIDAYAGETRRAFPAASTAERPLVIYAEVCVPEDQKPGRYRGQLVLEAKGRAKQRVPVSLEVQPFAIPATSSLPNSFGISQYGVARGHRLALDSDEARTTLRRYATALLRHRVTAHGMSMTGPSVVREGDELRFDFTAYDREMAAFFEGKVLASGARFTTAELREAPRSLDEAEQVAWYRAFREHFEAKKWPVTLFYYAKDEPKPEELSLVKRQASRVRKAGKIPVLVTTHLNPKLEGAADILTPVMNCFFPRKDALETCHNIQPVENVRRQLPKHAKVWWYQSCMSHGCHGGPIEDPKLEQAYSGWASYMVDHPSTANRAMGPLAYLAGIDGELYFDTVYAFPRGDPWESVFHFGGNGDGTLFYPGTPERIGGTVPIPIESLRLKHIRDGLEDYELLRLLAQRGGAGFVRTQLRTLVRSGYDVADDPRAWESLRAKMIRRINALPARAEYPARRSVGP